MLFLDLIFNSKTYFFQRAIGLVFFHSCLCIAAHLEVIHEIAEDQEIKFIVKHHLKIVKLIQRLNGIFWIVVLTQFIVMALVLCVTGVQIIISDDFSKIMAAIFHTFASCFDVALFAYAAQRVIDSGLVAFNRLYKLNKDYIPLIAMSQKSLEFKTGFFSASMETLSALLSRTISFIAVMKSFN